MNYTEVMENQEPVTPSQDEVDAIAIVDAFGSGVEEE